MRRPLLSECARPGCTALTMGDLCIRHEEPVTRVFPRGRPFPGAAASLRPAASGSRRGPDIALVSAASARARHATAASAQASLHRSL